MAFVVADGLERFVPPSRFMRQFLARVPAGLVGARDPLPGSILVIDDQATIVR